MWHLLPILLCGIRAEIRHTGIRVYQGQADFNNDFPFVVSLQYKDGRRMCTCSAIAETWIITAAHCIQKKKKGIIIKYADFTSNATKAYSKIIKVFRHPGFFVLMTEMTIANDLGLMLIEKMPSKIVAKLSAIDYKGLMGMPVRYAGFGVTVEDSLANVIDEGDNLRALQTGDAVVVPCEHVWPMFGPAICVAPKCSNKHQDTRPGDSGGPLVLDGKIIGVLTGSNGEEPISYYAPVSPNLNWISDVMRKYS